MRLSNPILIEVTGSLGVGKAWIVEAISKTFGCPGISFPTLDPNSFTSTALMKGYQSPDVLLANPQWWAHMAAANIYEHLPKLQHEPLVILKNYVTGYRNWFSALGVEQAGAYVSALPRPNLVFVCRGDQLPLAYAVNEPTNSLIEGRYERRIAQIKGSNVHVIDYDFFKEGTTTTDGLLSLIATTLCEKIRNKYALNYQLKPKNASMAKLGALNNESEETTG